MKYDEYEQHILQRLVEQIDNPCPGTWQGKGHYAHIIGNPASNSQEQIDIINKYILLPNVPEIDNNIHLHQCAHHLNSSQIMCYNFFRPLMKEYDAQTKMYKPADKLVDLIGMLIDTPIDTIGSVCTFEYIPKGKEHTNFDFYFRNGDIEVFFEIKYTEREFSKGSSSKSPSKQYAEIYKELIANCKDVFVKEGLSEEDVNRKYYQLVRNSIRATSNDKHVFFVCPQAHENLISQFDAFSTHCLTDHGRNQVRLITWEDLVQAASRLSINVNDFNRRYLTFLP